MREREKESEREGQRGQAEGGRESERGRVPVCPSLAGNLVGSVGSR